MQTAMRQVPASSNTMIGLSTFLISLSRSLFLSRRNFKNVYSARTHPSMRVVSVCLFQASGRQEAAREAFRLAKKQIKQDKSEAVCNMRRIGCLLLAFPFICLNL